MAQKNGNGKRYLNQEHVTRYAKICALLKKWEERRTVLREELIEGLAEGKLCPKGGPYLIVKVEEERKSLSWKDAWQDLAKSIYGDKWRKKMAELEDEAPRLPIVKLLPQVNPDYRLDRPDSTEGRR